MGKIAKNFPLALVVILLALAVALDLWLVQFSHIQAVEFLSPLPSGKATPTVTDPFLDKVSKRHTVDKYSPSKYFPDSLTIVDDGKDWDIDAKAYIAIDRDSRKILVGKNITTRLPIASLTKIVTAIIALENGPLSLETAVSSEAASLGEATMGLSPGEKISVEEALYGMLLPSGNDAAETLAEGIGKYKLGTPIDEVDGGGAQKWFLDRMNEKVQSLGMLDTYFFNPTGLDGDNKERTNFSTVLDMAALTNYALSNNQFAKIVDTSEMIIPFKEGSHKAFDLYNILTFDSSFPGIKGVKPGISDFAQETLSSYIEKDGRRIIAVIFGSLHTKDDVVKIYKRIFAGV